MTLEEGPILTFHFVKISFKYGEIVDSTRFEDI
jgi:hypothetical protein